MKDFTIATEYITNNPNKESIVLTDEVGFSSQLLENQFHSLSIDLLDRIERYNKTEMSNSDLFEFLD